MQTEQAADWRRKETYRYMEGLTRLDWAWEFLRRNPKFQADHATAMCGDPSEGNGELQRWGVVYADSPFKDATEVKVLWDPAICPLVLPLLLPSAPGDRKDLAPKALSHVLICDGVRRLQVLLRDCALPETIGPLTEAIMAPEDVALRLRSLACFNDFVRDGRLHSRHFRSDGRHVRLASVAQALDGALSAAPYREIAIALLGRDRVTTAWRHPGEYLRDHVRRAIRRGRALMNGGYRRFLT